MPEAGAIKIDNVGISPGPDFLVEKARPFGGIDALVAVGGGEPGALMRNQETCAVALADNVISHHVGHFVVDAVELKIPKERHRPPLGGRAQPFVQEIALPDRFDYRGIGTFEFHRGLTEFQHVARRNTAGRAMEEVAVDDGAQLRHWQRVVSAGDVPGSVEFLKRSALPTLSR